MGGAFAIVSRCWVEMYEYVRLCVVDNNGFKNTAEHGRVISFD